MPLIGVASLARMAFAGVDLAPVAAGLLERAANDPGDADAVMDMSTVMHLRGQPELGLALQAQALAMRQVYRLGTGEGPRVLVIVSAGDLAQNNVVEFLLEGSGVRLELLYLAPGLPLPAVVPEHDLVFVAVCESDRNRPLLEWIALLFASWPRRVLNPPERIARLSRDRACELIGAIPGLFVPTVRRVDRNCLDREEAGFPLIVRPVDSHKGQGLRSSGRRAKSLPTWRAVPKTNSSSHRSWTTAARTGCTASTGSCSSRGDLSCATWPFRSTGSSTT